tara:strand:+ start:184 stop:300 length:117 start_codon:yes stop_codon:yes gene_type:complete
MKKKVRVISIQNCGGKKKGSCNTWAGATTLQTTIRIAA